MKLRITVDGKAFEVDVEILDGAESAPEYPPYPPASTAYDAVNPAELTIAAQSTEVVANDKECRSPVTGMVIQVAVEPGQALQPNDVVMVLESMKMEIQITAPQVAVVKNVLVAKGTSVKVNQLLVEYE